MIGKTILHYKILSKLGEGGMGVVYRAEDTKLKREVAIKFLPRQIAASDEERERFKIEAQAAAALNHANIATVYNIEEADDETFIVMEYIKGQELKEKIDAGPLSIVDTLNIAIQIAKGLRAAHVKDVIHRDIKSANIMLTDESDVKIMDFGLAKVRGGPKLTKEQSTLGTAPYMSPEQTRGEEVNHRTDIFSLGVLIYEMLTGKLPFKGDYDQAVTYSILNEDPEPITALRTGIPLELERIVNKCLQKEPSLRYQHADELQADLKALEAVQKSGVSKTHAKSVGATTGTRPQKRTFLYGGIAAIVLLAAVIWILTLSSSSSEKASMAKSSTPSIAVMYFENRSSEDELDKILVDMLTTNLARHDKLDVVSSQRLFDILKNLGKLDIGTIDRTVATEVANIANVNTMLMGSIIQIGNKLRVTSQLSDVKTGDIIASEQVEGEKIEDIFAMVDELTEKISNKLVVSPREPTDQSPRIADATTLNYRAYQFYQRGLEYFWRFDFANAAKNFERSLDIDSTFAMAHLRLGEARYLFSSSNHYVDLLPARERMVLAKRYANHATRKDRLYIVAAAAFFERQPEESVSLFSDFVNEYPDEKEGWFFLGVINYSQGQAEQGLMAMEKVLELDPAHANAQNFLSYFLVDNDRYEEALASARQYINMQPDVLNTYDSAWEIAMSVGKLDSAQAVCQEALKIGSNWSGFNRYLGYTHLFRGDGQTARSSLRQGYPDDTARFLLNAGYFDLYEGRYYEALNALQKAVQTARTEKNSLRVRDAMIHKGKMLTVMKRFDEALKAFGEAKEFAKNLYSTNVTPVDVIAAYWSGVIYLKEGNHQKAQTQAEIIQTMVDKNRLDRLFMDYAYLLQAEIELANGDARSALKDIERVGGYSRNWPRLPLLRARALSQIGRIEAAANVLRKAKDNIESRKPTFSGGDYFEYFYLRSQANYLFGRLYERGGDVSQAIEYYTKAVEQWKDADRDLPELIDAKARLAELKGEG